MKKRASLGTVGRAVVVALGAVMAATLVAAPAQASQEWWVNGPDRVVSTYKDYAVGLAHKAARDDLAYMIAHPREVCRHDSMPARGGKVNEYGVHEYRFVAVKNTFPNEIFYATLKCVKNRQVG